MQAGLHLAMTCKVAHNYLLSDRRFMFEFLKGGKHLLLSRLNHFCFVVLWCQCGSVDLKVIKWRLL